MMKSARKWNAFTWKDGLRGIAIPFWDDKGNYYLANPDGSEDLVNYDVETRSYQVLSRVAQAGQGRYAYLIK